MSYTITKIRCPSCAGSGLCPTLGFTCSWCEGTARLPRAEALRYAGVVYALAGGGYIAGDHSLQDMRDDEARADAVYALFHEAPPWRKSPEAPRDR